MKPSRQTLSDEEIVELLLKRDTKGIELLYDKYGDYIYGFIYKIVRLDDFAQTVLQDTFLKVWSKIAAFDVEKGMLLTWLIRIARNLAIDMTRSKNYKNSLRLNGLSSIPFSQTPIVSGISIDNLDVEDKVATLDQKSREVLQLIYFGGYTTKEAAEELGIPLGTAKSRVRKGFKELRNIFGG